MKIKGTVLLLMLLATTACTSVQRDQVVYDTLDGAAGNMEQRAKQNANSGEVTKQKSDDFIAGLFNAILQPIWRTLTTD
ncbi:hypothetical protein P2G88_19350 [Aliiglaciecola sp. CAU 1673]|uniref:hypothetical protein n=1 Tax=Aliiglaciecola sp. CAU 1673 TaxID=3032595 RepID=UPI0023DAA55B|nr:hypothetical protein [Aliiglaciecola sp. CAU 1673]MDF2180421.1 hypothetical protein [Aliiglaciecola sp. CAU 1673]